LALRLPAARVFLATGGVEGFLGLAAAFEPRLGLLDAIAVAELVVQAEIGAGLVVML
jgi:hypothetical protein